MSWLQHNVPPPVYIRVCASCVYVRWLPCRLATGRLPRTCMHAEIGASPGRSLRSLHRTMAVSDAWLSRSLRESVRDRGPSHSPSVAWHLCFCQVPHRAHAYTGNSFFIYFFYFFRNADEGWCWNAFLTARINKSTLRTELECSFYFLLCHFVRCLPVPAGGIWLDLHKWVQQILENTNSL